MAQENRDNQIEQIELFSFDPIVVVLDVLKRWYLVLAAVLLVGMVVYVGTELTYEPKYTTTTTFVVTMRNSSSTVYQNLSATTNLATVFSEILNSSILRKAVLEDLGLSSFAGSISAAAVKDINLLTLNVTGADPRTTFLVTQSIIDNHHRVTYQVMGDIILEVLQEPIVPTAPTNPLNPVGNMKKAMILVGAAMCVLLGVLSFIRDAVRSKQEAEKKLDCRILGELHHERKVKNLNMLFKRKKSSILITSPSTSFSFAERVRKLRRRIEQHMPEGGKTILVTSVLENEGKSTVAVNLALSLAQKHKKVLLIDCDLRKPACYKILEQDWRNASTSDVANGKAELLDCVAVYGQEKALSLLLERKSVKNSAEIISSAGMAKLVMDARENFDYVIIDTPPMAVAPDAEGLLELVDASVLVVRQNAAPTKMLNSALDTLHSVEAKLLGCVLNNMTSSVLTDQSSYGYGYSYSYGYGSYGKYGRYGKYGKYGAYSSQNGKRSKAGTDHE